MRLILHFSLHFFSFLQASTFARSRSTYSPQSANFRSLKYFRASSGRALSFHLESFLVSFVGTLEIKLKFCVCVQKIVNSKKLFNLCYCGGGGCFPNTF